MATLASAPTTIVVVFLLTTWSLGISVQRDLNSSSRSLRDFKQHLRVYSRNPAEGQELVADVTAALNAIFRSEISVFLLVQWFFSAYAVFALITIALFLGRLSPRETSRLSERLIKFIIFKVVFCGALIIPDIFEIVLWLAWFAMVGYMRVFMGAAKDRLEALAVSPSASTSAHLRTLALVLLILLHDIAGLAALLALLGSLSLTKVLLCSFDIAIVLVEGMKTLLRYAVHLWDQHVAQSLPDQQEPGEEAGRPSSTLGWESWEGKGSLLYHMELAADVLVHSLTLAHYLHVWFLHGLSFQLIDAILFLDIRSIISSMLKRIRGYLNYRRATHCLRHAFPDAVPGSGNEQCTICMDRMATAKQLPCGHHFHLACLRAWLQQSGMESFACPLCRTPLMRQHVHSRAEHQQQQQQQHRVRPRRWVLLDMAARLASRLYLDVVLALLLGMPISLAMLQQRHAAAGGGGHSRRFGQGHEGGRRRHGSREQPGQAVEQVDENDAAGPREATPLPAARRRSLWQLLLGGAGHRAAGWQQQQQQQQQQSAGEAEQEDVSSDVISEEMDSEEDLHDVAAEDDSLQAGRHTLHRRRAWPGQVPSSSPGPSLSALAGQQGAQGRQHGPDADERHRTDQPPLYPPPYPEPATWSAGSLQLAAHHVAETIRSSLGMGVHGAGAVAGYQHSTDQEVDSPYRGPSAAQQGRTRQRTGRRAPRGVVELPGGQAAAEQAAEGEGHEESQADVRGRRRSPAVRQDLSSALAIAEASSGH